MSGWIAQRECAHCDFSGPEVEFLAVGLDLFGQPMMMQRDNAPPNSVLICMGCAATLGRLDQDSLSAVVRGMLETDLPDVPDTLQPLFDAALERGTEGAWIRDAIELMRARGVA